MAEATSLETRLNELEVRYMEQQALVEDLSAVVYAQQRALDQAEARLAQLEKKVAGEPGIVDAKQHDRPPHY